MKSKTSFLALLTLASLPVDAAYADQWGCEVLLCLSNPAGPTAVEQCKPPIYRLWNHLRDGHAFPSCDMAQDPEGASYAKQGFSHYDPCPVSTRALANGERAAQGSLFSTGDVRSPSKGSRTIHIGIGNAEGYLLEYRSDGLPNKICVGTKIGVVSINNTDARSSAQVSLYDRVIALPPHRSPRIIDVYIKDTFYQRVRW